MAVPTATAVFVVVSAALVVVSASSLAVVAVTAASACQVFHQVVDFFFRGITVFDDFSFEEKRFASQRVVQVHLDFLFAHLDDTSIEAVALFVLQGNDGLRIDVHLIMSLKTKFNTYSKSFKEKKNYITKNSIIKNFSLKDDYDLFPQNKLFDIYSIIHKNIKKHSTSTREYHILIINSIIFDQRIHKVAVFKNNLLWDESSEFLKRYYKKKESTERIPKIAEYYEKYTLFPPFYFGLEGLIVIIINKWTKRKKNYLEYIEDQEEEKEKKKKIKKDISFEPLIHSSLINNKTSSKSILSRNTLDLSKVDNESNKAKVYNTNKNNQLKKNFNKNLLKKNKDKKKENLNSLSFSEIIDDLSSQYSIIINNAENDANFKLKDKEIEIDKKYKKDQNNIIRDILKQYPESEPSHERPAWKSPRLSPLHLNKVMS